MKQLFSLMLMLLSVLLGYSNTPIILNPPTPPPRIGEESMTTMSFSILSTKLSKKSIYESTSFAYYPVMANVDEVALTVTFTESVGIANVLVYDANDQLVDMVTVDTSSSNEAVISTETWTSGSYKLVVTYGTTTLEGNFNF